LSAIVEKIRIELQQAVDPATKDGYKRYFKEEVNFYGLKAASVHAIARKYWNEVKLLKKGQIFALCDELLRSEIGEEAILVGIWLPKMKRRYVWEDIFIFQDWIDKYINNWAECDTFCNHTMNEFLGIYPEAIHVIKSWADSDNRWMKRASAVSLVIPARKGKCLEDIFEIADKLLSSGDDMVQKGYGWMLKEASKAHMQEVFDFVIQRRQTMPRTALRYAIEKMPEEMRREAMRK